MPTVAMRSDKAVPYGLAHARPVFPARGQPTPGSGAPARLRGVRLTLAVVLLGACTTPTTSPPEPPPEPPAPPPQLPDPAESEAFLALLDIADRAVADDRLLTPEDDSAYLYYHRALAMAPNSPAPVRGFERIVESYLQKAQLAIERQQWTRAGVMLDRAAFVDRDHTGISAVRQQLDLLANAERLILRLGSSELRKRSSAIAAKLVEFGDHARAPNARVSIRAPSDADARWIYQQLSRSPGDRRIRGETEIGLPPQVVVMLLPLD